MSASSETWTIGRLLEWTKDFLDQRGVDNPRLDAEVLLAHARNCQRIELYTAFDEIAGDDVRGKFRELVSQRAQGKPVAYLVGYKEFFSLTFEITPDVLIPRPETEMLVMAVLDVAKQMRAKRPLAIADVGTGSGCIAVAVATQLPDCRVAAIDQSPAALAVAKRNAVKHGVSERIEFIESDLFAAADAQKQFDIIVSNPPYVTEVEHQTLARRFTTSNRRAPWSPVPAARKSSNESSTRRWIVSLQAAGCSSS